MPSERSAHDHAFRAAGAILNMNERPNILIFSREGEPVGKKLAKELQSELARAEWRGHHGANLNNDKEH